MRNKVVLKIFGIGFVKMHGFHSNPVYDSKKMGVCLQNQSYLGCYLS